MYLSYFPSIYSCIYLSIYQSLYPSIYPIHLSLAIPLKLCIYLTSIFNSFHLHLYPSIHLSILLYIFLSIFLTIPIPSSFNIILYVMLWKYSYSSIKSLNFNYQFNLKLGKSRGLFKQNNWMWIMLVSLGMGYFIWNYENGNIHQWNIYLACRWFYIFYFFFCIPLFWGSFYYKRYKT